MMSEYVIADYGKYRAIAKDPKVPDGDTVFVQRLNGGIWEDISSFNARSDDYAYTNASDYAKRRARADERPEVAG